MKRSPGRLTALAVSRITARGMHADGSGLYLSVARNGSRSWVFRFRKLDGSAGNRDLGLGPLRDVPLALARERATEARRLVFDGIDPIAARRARKAGIALAAARSMTFDDAATEFIAAHAAGWRNVKHGSQWTATLATHVSPTFGRVAIADVDTGLVLRALEKIWTDKPETASRVRGRVEAVLDWARVRGFRTGENPARWKGHLDHLLPKVSKVRAVKHHAALPYTEMGSFMTDLRGRDGIAARCLEFTILTAARTGEAIGATFAEFDLDAAVWTVSGKRMKAGKEHRVPMSDKAVAIVRDMQVFGLGEYVFTGLRKSAPISNMSMLAVLKRMDRDDLTTHGFRSTFRDWAAECTAYPGEVVEMALAHAVASKVEAAYRRGDLFEKRRRLMSDWALFCARGASTGADIIPMRGA